MVFHHALKLSACAVAIILGCTASYAGSLETINVGKIGRTDGSDFVGKGGDFSLLPYQMASRSLRRGHSARADREVRASDATFVSDAGSTGLFEKFNVLPHSKSLNINGICYQRELGGPTVLDSAQSASDLDGEGIEAIDPLQGRAVITVNMTDASIASLAAISVAELQGESQSAIDSSAIPAGSTASGDATTEQIMADDAAAEAEIQAMQDGNAADAEGISGEVVVASLDPTEAPNIPDASDGSMSDGSIDTGAVENGSGDSSGGPVLAGELPEDLGAAPSVGVELEPVSLEEESSGGNGESLSDVPLPAAFPLLASVLAGIGIMSVRRSRKSI